MIKCLFPTTDYIRAAAAAAASAAAAARRRRRRGSATSRLISTLLIDNHSLLSLHWPSGLTCLHAALTNATNWETKHAFHARRWRYYVRLTRLWGDTSSVVTTTNCANFSWAESQWEARTFAKTIFLVLHLRSKFTRCLSRNTHGDKWGGCLK